MKRAGAFAVRDPRVTEEDNNKFLDLLESYFEQPEGIKYNIEYWLLGASMEIRSITYLPKWQSRIPVIINYT